MLSKLMQLVIQYDELLEFFLPKIDFLLCHHQNIWTSCAHIYILLFLFFLFACTHSVNTNIHILKTIKRLMELPSVSKANNAHQMKLISLKSSILVSLSFSISRLTWVSGTYPRKRKGRIKGTTSQQ